MHLNKYTVLLVMLLLGTYLPLQAQLMERGSKKQLIEDFIPQGWNVILHTQGDLNKDGIDDHVVVIEENNPKKLKLNDGLGMDTLNLNTRILLVFFKIKGGYQLAAKNDRQFIPSQNDENSPCLADPLTENGGISIENGLLKIAFHYWLSCGSWYVNDALYTFRYQHGGFELIGFDHQEFHRSSGERSATSINYSISKRSTTSAGNMFAEQIDKPKTTWSTLKKRSLYKLDNCSENTYFEILEIKK